MAAVRLNERMLAALLALQPEEAAPPHVIGEHHGATWNALERRGLVEWAPHLTDDQYELLLTPEGVEAREVARRALDLLAGKP